VGSCFSFNLNGSIKFAIHSGVLSGTRLHIAIGRTLAMVFCWSPFYDGFNVRQI
jgi:hypothetical protein